MRAYVAVVALCTIAALLTSEPCCGSGDDQEAPAVSWHSPTPAVGTENKTEKAYSRPPSWCTALKKSEWWLVIIAALTGFAIAYQAREMTRATNIIYHPLKYPTPAVAALPQRNCGRDRRHRMTPIPKRQRPAGRGTSAR